MTNLLAHVGPGPSLSPVALLKQLQSSPMAVQLLCFGVLLLINVAILWKSSDMGQQSAMLGPMNHCESLCREANSKGLRLNFSALVGLHAPHLLLQTDGASSSSDGNGTDLATGADTGACAPCAPCAPCLTCPPWALAPAIAPPLAPGSEDGDEIAPASDGVDVFYQGEFGFEVIYAIPFAYFHFLNGSLRSTATCDDLGPLYYFSKNHTSNACKRSLKGNVEGIKMFGLQWGYHASPLPIQWHPPPYKTHFQEKPRLMKEVEAGTPFLILSNKYENWGTKLENTIPLPSLVKMFEQFLQAGFMVVYNRPHKLIKPDAWQAHAAMELNGTGEFMGDFQMIEEKFAATGRVKTMQQIYEEHKGLTFNEMQVRLFARSQCFVSVQGGNSAFASYFGGKNIIFVTHSEELSSKAYERYHPKLSGANIVVTQDVDSLEKEVIAMVQSGGCGAT